MKFSNSWTKLTREKQNHGKKKPATERTQNYKTPTSDYFHTSFTKAYPAASLLNEPAMKIFLSSNKATVSVIYP